MTRDILILKLSVIGVHENSYSLGKIQNSDCTCVVEENGKWSVYYVERDKPDKLAVFDSVEDAYSFVYEIFCKWLGNK